MVQVRIPELSGEAFESVTVTALPLAPGDLGFSDDARGPSHSAVHALLGRSFSGDTEQEDEGMGGFSWYSADCRFSECWSGPDSGARILWAPRGGRGRAATPRAGSSAAVQLQIFEELSCFGSRITAVEQQTVVQRPANHSPRFLGAPHTSSPGVNPIAEARRLAGMGTGSGDPANVTRRAAATCVRAVPRPNAALPSGPLGLEDNMSRFATSVIHLRNSLEFCHLAISGVIMGDRNVVYAIQSAHRRQLIAAGVLSLDTTLLSGSAFARSACIGDVKKRRPRAHLSYPLLMEDCCRGN